MKSPQSTNQLDCDGSGEGLWPTIRKDSGTCIQRAYLMHSEQMSCSRRCRTLACLVACLVATIDAQLSCPFTAPSLTAGQLASICATWPTSAAPACSLQRLCASNVRPPVFPTLCNTSRLAANLCLDDIAIASAVPECNRQVSSNSTPGRVCVTHALGLAGLLQNTRAACDAMDDMPMDGCDTCPAMDDCPDPLGSLAAGCVEMRMTPCRTSGWTAFCSDPAQGGLGGFGRAAAHLCLAPSLWPTVRAPPSLPPPPPLAPPPPPPSPASCLSSPSLPSCATYTYPAANVSADIAKLCEAMPDMPGCSIQAACQAGTVPASSSACVPFTLLATLCTDMPGMNGCGPWKALCLPAASQVQQCRTYPPIPSAPSWMASRRSVFSLCSVEPQEECAGCTPADCPDPLATLSALCLRTTTSPACAGFAAWRMADRMSWLRCSRTLACLVGCLVAAIDAQLSCPFTAPSLTAGQLASICATWPISAAPACSLQRLCASNVRPPVFPTLCNTSRLAAKLCLDDIAVASAVPECSSLQAQHAFVQSNPGCVQALGLLSTRNIAAILQARLPSHSCHFSHHQGVTMARSLKSASEPCLSSPSLPSCATYTYPAANVSADIAKLCGAMPDMPGCSIQAACQAGTVPASSSACVPFTLLATLCTDMPGMNGCGPWKALCLPAASQVQQCRTYPPIPSAPNWSDTTSNVAELCGSGSAAACANCTLADCPDPLATLSALCLRTTTSPACAGFAAWCAAANTNASLSTYCSLPQPPAPPTPAPPAAPLPVPLMMNGTANVTSGLNSSSTEPLAPPPRVGGMVGPPNIAPMTMSPGMSMTPSPTSPEASPAEASCLSSPSLPSCATYTYPAANVSADIAKLCGAMPDMPGCSIQAACKAGTVPASSSACVPFTLLATLCTDMPGMNGCGPWKALCLPAASQVQQCRTYPPIPSAPSWAASRQAVFSACGEMGMPQCEQCRQASCPDPLAALAGMCIDMPTMSQCGVYASWCVAANTDGSLGVYCKGAQPGDVGLPSMLMYFHERIRELVLWRTWVPNTQGQYAGTIICIMCFGVVSMGLKTWVTLLNMDWKVRWLATDMPLSKHWLLPSKQQLGHACIKAVIMGVSITLDYFNMLIAMTFNVGMFCAVVLGYVLGVFFFSHIPDNWAARQLHAKQAADRQRMYGEPRDVEVHMQPSPSGSWKAMQDGQDMSDTKEGNMPSCCPGHP
ncbi:hypothetical protein QJQ45_029765 [Haematococcus lacustris]|nr:hypothetical protein QJQ45_029765 [Haematococcus lacustris]